ncbi:unnamed protein product, partial [Nesidiocoris tenuis]
MIMIIMIIIIKQSITTHRNRYGVTCRKISDCADDRFRRFRIRPTEAKHREEISTDEINEEFLAEDIF